MPVEPTAHKDFVFVVIAKNQPEYLPLPAITDGRYVITKWRMSWRERLSCVFRGHLHLAIKTFGNPLQPIKLSVMDELK